ncbi:MAG: enoyl-CoA hydratase/isomerase family protein [Salibacteraceae bacterium]
MSDAYVNVSKANGIATIEFFHPQSNSLPGRILNELAEEISSAGKDKNVLAILLKSGGDRAFCAGASFDELIAIEDEQTGHRFFSGFANVINAMRTCPKFIIGRVQGKTVGGGVGVASSMDYCFATKHAAIKLSELAVGIGPFVVGPAVERKTGKAGFTELSMAATEWRDAEWAKNKGIYAEVYDDVDSMDKAIAGFLDKIKSYNPAAMSEMKKIYWQGTEHWDSLLQERAQISGKLVLSEFTRNAINKFKSKS